MGKINKTLIVFVMLISCIIAGKAQTQYPKLNWGIRLGLNAVSITNYEVFNGDEALTNASYTNKNGYLVNAFARFNMKRLFLQPELGWNNYHRTCSFSLPVENNSSYHTDLDIHSKAVNANCLLGYNIVHDYPFLLGVFIGTSFMGTYKTDYSIDPAQSFSQTGLSLNYSGILGFSINISKIYFDLRYAMSLPDSKLNLTEIPGFPNNYQNTAIKKTESILSFSVGVMF
jgi:hypothetical protein